MRTLTPAFLFFCCLLPALSIQAQLPLQFRWSGPNKMQRNDHHHQVFAADSTAIYCLGFHPVTKDIFDSGTPVLDQFDWDLQRKKSRVLAGFDQTDTISFQGLIQLMGYSYVFYYKELEHKLNVFFVRRINLEENRFEGEAIQIGDTMKIVRNSYAFLQPLIINGPLFALRTVSVGFTLNGDKIAFLFYKDLQDISIHVFNRKMKPMWSKRCSFPFDNRGITLSDFKLTRSGNLILEFQQFENLIVHDWDKRKEDDRFNYFLFMISGQEESANIFQLNIGKPYYGELLGKEDKDGLLHYYTTYSDLEYNRQYGLVEYTIDPMTKTMTPSEPIPFPSEITRQMGFGVDAKHPNSVLDFHLQDVHKTSETEIIGEFFNAKGIGTIQDFVLFRYDSSFQNMRSTKIYKAQAHSTKDDYREYAFGKVFLREGDTYLLYNKDFSSGNLHIYQAVWAKTGNVENFPAAPPTDKKALLIPASSYLYRDKLLVLAEAELHDQYYLGVFDKE